METHEYRTFFEFESFYWWYKALHAVLLDTLHQIGLAENAYVLDAGCGTGQNLTNISQCLGSRAVGFDISQHAAPFWALRGLERVLIASINEIPLPSDTFEAVLCVDIFESEAVNELQAYRELWRVVKPGGFLLIVVPAYDWLLSREHHQAVHAIRRYTKRKLLELVQCQPVQIMRLTHLFASVFPAVAIFRILLSRFIPAAQDRPRSELRRLPAPLNALLLGVMALERWILIHRDLPFGSSILMVAQKLG